MKLLLVRHGQSTANRDGIMQGQYDSPLSDLGRRQAIHVAGWFRQRGLGWDACYCSPLARARETAAIIRRVAGGPEPSEDRDLLEVHAGSMQNQPAERLKRDYPQFYERSLDQLGDYSEFGGESYEQVQRRVQSLIERLSAQHRQGDQRVLVVSHGGLLLHLSKALICLPTPRVHLIRYSNCSATLIALSERRGRYVGEIQWHVPIDLTGGEPSGGATALLY